MFGFELI